MTLAVGLLALGVLLVVAGVALWSIPAALIVAGLSVVAVSLFADLPTKKRKR